MNGLNARAWESAAEDVLSVLVYEDFVTGSTEFWNEAVTRGGLNTHHFPAGINGNDLQALFAAMKLLRLEGRSVTWAAVSEITGEAVSEQFFNELAALYDDLRLQTFDENVAICVRQGDGHFAYTSLVQAAEDIRRGTDARARVDNLMRTVLNAGSAYVTGERASELVDTARRNLARLPGETWSCGIPWIDLDTGGIGGFWAIAGAYKSRKTTLANNMVLASLKAGKSVAILSLENLRGRVLNDLAAMLAVEWLMGVKTYDWDDPDFFLSGRDLSTIGTRIASWSQLKRQAVEYAYDTLSAVGARLRIYDQTAEGGGLGTSESIVSCVRRDRLLYHGDGYVIDHAQLIDRQKGEIYERVSYVSRTMQTLTRDDINPPAIIMLAQRNEQSINSSGGYGAGIKGGGDLSADVDVMILLRPILEYTDEETGEPIYYSDRAKAVLKFNRNGPMGEAKMLRFQPDSGLMLATKTFTLEHGQLTEVEDD